MRAGARSPTCTAFLSSCTSIEEIDSAEGTSGDQSGTTSAQCSGGVGTPQLCLLGNRDVECRGHIADAGETGRPVVRGLVTLDLLLGDPERLGEPALRPPAGYPGLHEQRSQICERRSLEGRYRSRPEALVLL